MIAHRRIYLTGFMGSGKSTIGPRVARLLGFDSMDLDDEISRDLGMSLPAIFDVLGEEAFRRAESEHLRSAGGSIGVVVSLGGGTLVRPENLEFCLETGCLVALDVDTDTLVKRLAGSPNPRPLLQDESGHRLRGEALRSRIEGLLEERRSTYERAHLVLRVGDESADDVARRVIERLQGEADD
jgi:shikimate kinase